jgi:urea transport system ATP-binding protein
MLNVNNLSVNYGESSILTDVSLNIPTGQVVCLMGRNGVGKTTLMKTIMGILKPRQGQIIFDGEDLVNKPVNRRARAGIGYVPQGRGIFPRLTVYENLLMGFEALPKNKPDPTSLERVYATFPVLKDMRKRIAGTLSGGQQQQLALGRVLVRRPKMLLLDEPTEGIQPSITLDIENVIRSLQAQDDLSILLVEQFLDFALSIGSYFYIMETGSIVMEGPAEKFDENAAKEYLAV